MSVRVGGFKLWSQKMVYTVPAAHSTINNLTATDSGIVQCVADNPLGVASADTTLSVLSRYLGNVMFGYPTVTCK